MSESRNERCFENTENQQSFSNDSAFRAIDSKISKIYMTGDRKVSAQHVHSLLIY